jgi:hypothetical protein
MARSEATTKQSIFRQNRRVGKANGSRECAPDDKLRVPTIQREHLDGGHGASAPLPTLGLKPIGWERYPSNTASAPFTASALSITVRSSEAACTEMFSAKNRASVT